MQTTYNGKAYKRQHTDRAHTRRHKYRAGDIRRFGQSAREILCELFGHKPRERVPFHGAPWYYPICGRCGRYPA